MKANEIRLYDLNAVNTTIVLQELRPNPDVQNIFLYDLEATNTNIKLRYFGEVSAGGSTAWTQNLADTVTLSEAISNGIGLIKADTVTLSEEIIKAIGVQITDSVTLNDSLSGGIPGGQLVLAYRWYWVKIYIQRLEGRNVYRIKIFD